MSALSSYLRPPMVQDVLKVPRLSNNESRSIVSSMGTRSLLRTSSPCASSCLREGHGDGNGSVKVNGRELEFTAILRKKDMKVMRYQRIVEAKYSISIPPKQTYSTDVDLVPKLALRSI